LRAIEPAAPLSRPSEARAGTHSRQPRVSVADHFFTDKHWWPWVPAFAGTRIKARQFLSSHQLIREIGNRLPVDRRDSVVVPAKRSASRDPCFFTDKQLVVMSPCFRRDTDKARSLLPPAPPIDPRKGDRLPVESSLNSVVVPAKRSASRDPLDATSCFSSRPLLHRQTLVVMGPCFRRDTDKSAPVPTAPPIDPRNRRSSSGRSSRDSIRASPRNSHSPRRKARPS
jgi:hypothetical protein